MIEALQYSLSLWPLAVAIASVVTAAAAMAMRGYVRIDVGTSVNVGIQLGKAKP
jgi:hypothetical protein